MGASQEWDSVHNDVCLIVMKGSTELLKKEIVRFPYERRYDEAFNLELHYNFLCEWINTNNKRKILLDFVFSHNAKKVCIYGQEYLGKLLYEELRDIDDIEVEIVDNKSKIESKNGALLIITILDWYRGSRLYLDKVWEGIPKFYLDDIFLLNKVKEFYEHNKIVYLYGAGVVAQRLAKCLTDYGLKPCGIVVSDGKRKQPFCNDMKIFELQELEVDKNTGIIIAVRNKFKDAIIQNLVENGFTNYLNL